MAGEQLTVVLHYEAQPGKHERARKELSELVSTVVKTEAECLGISLSQDPANPNHFLMFERWTDRAVYEGAHMQTDHMREFIEGADEFLTGPPEITMWTPIAEISK